MSILALALLQGAALAAPADAPAEAVALDHSAGEEEMLLFAAELDALALTEGLTAFGDPADPYLPIGELSRLLDLAVEVDVPGAKVSGTIGRQRREILLDLRSGTGRNGDRSIAVSPADFRLSASDAFVRAALVEALLPVRVAIDSESLTIRLTPTEPLPLQEQRARLARAAAIDSSQVETEEVLEVDSPYRSASMPGFDVVLEGGYDSREGPSRRYDLRAAADLLYGAVQAYVGSDREGRPRIARFVYERRSPAGHLPLGIRRFGAGDVFTPALALGPRSVGGRGVSLSSAPLEHVSIFDTIDLRGELPAGHDVELYVNDVLHGSRNAAIEGRYEFPGVPLSFGLNRIRIVIHGPRGERSEQARTINVGGGQLRAGETWFEAGLVQQERSLIEPGGRIGPDLAGVPAGAPRLVASVSHGVSKSLTLVAGVATYSAARGSPQHVATAGIRTPVGAFAVQADAARDSDGGAAVSVGAAGRLAGVSTVLRHSEYRGGFLDENAVLADPRRPMSSRTSLTADASLPLPGRPLPLSFRLMHTAYSDGGRSLLAGARLSTTLGGTLLSAGLDYQSETSRGGAARRQLSGMATASAFLGGAWQVRGVLDYEVLPLARLRTLAFTADRGVSRGLAMRLGVAHGFAGRNETSLQAGPVLRLPFGDIALNADYAPQRGHWRAGLRLSFGSLHDPLRRRYMLTRPGPAAGGAVAFHAFVDGDGDGRFGEGDEPVAGVAISGGEGSRVTDARGHAIATGFGSAPRGRLAVDLTAMEDATLAAPPAVVAFRPRAGQVVLVPYPLARVGEAYLRLTVRQSNRTVGISALRVRLVTEGGRLFEATTQFDGSVVLGDLPLGRYRLELDPEQAERLRISLAAPVSFALGPDESPTIEAEVRFAGASAEAATGDPIDG